MRAGNGIAVMFRSSGSEVLDHLELTESIVDISGARLLLCPDRLDSSTRIANKIYKDTIRADDTIVGEFQSCTHRGLYKRNSSLAGLKIYARRAGQCKLSFSKLSA